MTVYEVAELTKVYPKQPLPANDRISFTVEEGEVFGLLGANGAGKTTLIRQMVNLLAPSGGDVFLYGKSVASSPLYAPRFIGYMPQSGLALNTLTVSECLYFTAHLRGLSSRDAKAERDRLIERFGLGPVRNGVATRLSGGEKRLVLLATTTAGSPPVLILDEPTNDLDPERRLQVWDVIRELNRERGTTVILVTHNLVEAERIVGRVGIMKAGRLLAVGRPGGLKSGISERLHLEVVFSPGNPPVLPDGALPREVMPGRWKLLIGRDDAPAYTDLLAGSPEVEDFTLGTATLEDLYVSLQEDN